MERYWSRDEKFHLCKMNSFGDLMCTSVTIINNTISCT